MAPDVEGPTTNDQRPTTSDQIACYAQTMPGVERITWLEIRTRLPGSKFREYLFAKEQNGVVLFDYNGPLHQLLQLRTAEDVFLSALSLEKVSRDWGDLRLIARLVQDDAGFHRAAKTLLRQSRLKSPTYRVIARKYGQHQYKRKDLEAAVVKGVTARYGQLWRHVADNADVEIWVNLFGSRLLCGLRLSDRTMRHRYNKVGELPASLRPSVAAAMVFLTEPEAGDVFLDPLCGSGTLLLERLAFGGCRYLLGGDILPAHAGAARQNLGAQAQEPGSSRGARFLSEVEGGAEEAAAAIICQWDACRLPLASESVDKVATNLPFGKQVGTPVGIRQLYPCFFAELERVLKPGGRAAVLSSEFDLVKETVRQQKRLAIVTGYSVSVLGQWGRIYIVKREE